MDVAVLILSGTQGGFQSIGSSLLTKKTYIYAYEHLHIYIISINTLYKCSIYIYITYNAIYSLYLYYINIHIYPCLSTRILD